MVWVTIMHTLAKTLISQRRAEKNRTEERLRPAGN
jgi:hypothetical protein